MLAENLLLLALDDDKGTVPMNVATSLRYGLPAALIVELALQGCLSVEKERVRAIERVEPGHPLLEETLQRFADKPGKRISHWVQHLDHDLHGLQKRLLEGLVSRGTLERQDRRVLFFFTRTVYPEHDAHVEQDVRKRIDAVLLHGDDGDARLRLLIELVANCHLIEHLYAGAERKAARKRAREIRKLSKHHDDVGTEAGKAVKAAREAEQASAAAMVAVIAACSASSAACAAAAC